MPSVPEAEERKPFKPAVAWADMSDDCDALLRYQEAGEHGGLHAMPGVDDDQSARLGHSKCLCLKPQAETTGKNLLEKSSRVESIL